MRSGVLLVGDYPPPHGGISIHVAQLHDVLKRRGWHTRVLRLGRDGIAARNVAFAQTGLQLLGHLRKALRLGFLPHVHVSGNNPKAWLVLCAVGQMAALHGVPAVATLHSGLVPSFLEGRGMRGLAKAALSPFAHVIGVSPSVSRALRDAGMDDARIETIAAFVPDAVQAGRAPWSFNAIRARRRPLLAFANHPAEHYGRAVLLDALTQLRKSLPSVGVVVFGPGSLDARFQEDVSARGLEGHVDVLGELDHSEAMGVIARSDVFVRPTWIDGDAISVREALTLGVRCVASDAVARPQGVFTFTNRDSAELSRAVVHALSHRAQRHVQPDAVAKLESIYKSLGARITAPDDPRLEEADRVDPRASAQQA